MQATPDDLAANHAGSLSSRQAAALKRDYRFLMAGAVTGTPVVLLLAFFGFPAIARPVVIPITVLAELAILLAIYFLGVRPVVQVIARGRVDALIGTASWRRGWLYIGEQRVPLTRGSRPSIVDGQLVRAHVVPKGRIRLMGLEPVDSP